MVRAKKFARRASVPRSTAFLEGTMRREPAKEGFCYRRDWDLSSLP
jgi:hypothetical protein